MTFGERVLRAAPWLAAVIAANLLYRASFVWLAERDALIALCVTALVIELSLGLGTIACVQLAGSPPRRALGLSAGRLGWTRLGLAALGTLAASHALDGALDLFGLSEQSVLGELPRLLAGARGARLGLVVLSLCLAPAIAEEIFCRGLLQRSLVLRFGPAVAIPLAGLVFGALHVELIHGGLALVLGCYLGLIAYCSDSTRSAIGCHALNNLAAVLLAIWAGGRSWASEASVAAGALLAILCLVAVWRGRAAPPARIAEPLAVPTGQTAPPLQPDGRPTDR